MFADQDVVIQGVTVFEEIRSIIAITWFFDVHSDEILWHALAKPVARTQSHCHSPVSVVSDQSEFVINSPNM